MDGCRMYYYYKGLSTTCLYLIKHHWYTGPFMPVLHFSSDRALFQKEGFKKNDQEAAYHCHTNKYRPLLAAL